jgi:hypothetical protein
LKKTRSLTKIGKVAVRVFIGSREVIPETKI